MNTKQRAIFIGSILVGTMLVPMGVDAYHNVHGTYRQSNQARVHVEQTQRARQSQTSVIDVAVSVNQNTGEFSTLIAALQEVNLDRILDSTKREVTIFAPTDAGFANLGLTSENIGTELTKKQILYVLMHHIVRGELDSAEVLSSSSIRVLNGQYLKPYISQGNAFLMDQNMVSTDAQIVGVDNFAENGVIHVIDQVLLPNNFLE